MSTDLTSTKIKNTFNQLLHVDGGVTSTPKTVYDGDGTATSVKISISGLKVNNSEVLTDADIGNSIQPYDPELIQEIQDNADSAAASAVAAANSATNSGISAGQASGYKDQAATSALQAGNSATQAAASAASAAAIVNGVASNRPSIRPSLLLDFANTKQLDPRITFSRPTTASYYDGKTTAVAEQNLLTYSQQFDSSTWTKSNVTLVANTTTAPDGTSTGSLIYPASSGSFRSIYKAISSGGRVSFFVKAAGKSYVFLQSGGVTAAWFNVSTGTLGTGTGTITSVGNGWYRCSANVGSYAQLGISDADNSGSVTTNGTDGVYIWGAQNEQGSSTTAYTPTTSSPITNYIPALQTAAAGVPRFDHDPVTEESKGLLIEEQRTNLLTYSEQFDNAVWSKANATVTANTIVAPDGTLTGDRFIESATTSSHQIVSSLISTSVGAVTLSVYIKFAGRQYVQVFFGGNASGEFFANFDLVNGTSGSTSGSGISSSIQAIGNGWYRCSLINATSNGAGYVRVASVPSSTASVLQSYAGDGYSGIYIWGAQLEAGSFATSYIPTTSAQVTRSADVASMIGANFSSWYRTNEGLLYTEINTKSLAAANGVQLNDGTTSNRIRLALTSASDQGTVTYQGSAQATLDGGTPVAGTTSKLTIGYKLNDFALSLDGGAVATDTSGAIPVATQLQIGAETSTAGNLTIKRIMYWPKRLVNTELQGVTS